MTDYWTTDEHHAAGPPAADRPPLDLDAIRARAARYEEDRNIAAVHGLAASLTSADVGALLAEVTALRAELDAARASYELKVADLARETLAVETLARVLLDDNHSPDGFHAEGQRCRHCAALKKALRREEDDWSSVMRVATLAEFDANVARGVTGVEATLVPAWDANAAHAERTDPHDERDERCFACRNGRHSLCEPGEACACRCLGAERTEPATDDGSDVGAEFDPREPLMPRVVRTEPTTGEDVDAIWELRQELALHYEGFVLHRRPTIAADIAIRIFLEWLAKRAVEPLARAIHCAKHGEGLRLENRSDEVQDKYRELARVALSELGAATGEDDMALRDRLTEAEATIVRAQQALGSDHPVWWVLDDYDGSMDSVTALRAELDAARAEAHANAVECSRIVAEQNAVDAARAERTEPATGEDVETTALLAADQAVRAHFHDPDDGGWPGHSTVAESCSDCGTAASLAVNAVLAALDLPGRERALREAKTQWERCLDEALVVTAERDDARQRLANVTSALDDLKFANDQLQVARDNTAALLKEARAYIEAQHRLGLHDNLGVGLTCKGCALLVTADDHKGETWQA